MGIDLDPRAERSALSAQRTLSARASMRFAHPSDAPLTRATVRFAHCSLLAARSPGHCRDAYSLIGAEAGELHVSCEWLGL